jgi:ribosomal protein S18 acetylase RimI-like enzyme
MPLCVSYRSARKADLRSLVSMEAACFPPADQISRRSLLRFLRNPRRTATVDIILADGVPCGYAVYLTRKSSARIRYYSICVLPSHAGRGIARTYLTKRLREFGPGYREIVVAVSRSNAASIRLHQSVGFAFLDEPTFRYPNGEEGVRMRKDLRPARRQG